MVGRTNANSNLQNQLELISISTNSDTVNSGLITEILTEKYATLKFTAKNGSTRAGYYRTYDIDGNQSSLVNISSTSNTEYEVDVSDAYRVQIVLYQLNNSAYNCALSDIVLE